MTEPLGTSENMSKALDRIHEIAVKLLANEVESEEIRMGLDQIEALSRYRFDVLPEDGSTE